MHPNNPTTVSDACIELITRPGHDDCHLQAYLCPANKVTIGYGHVIVPKWDWHLFRNCDASRVARLVKECQDRRRMSDEALTVLRINPDQATELLHADVRRDAQFLSSVTPVPLTQPQFDALVSFIFNVGQGNYATSTLRKKLHDQDYAGAAAEFNRWVYATVNGRKQKLNGLITRRAAERALFEAKP